MKILFVTRSLEVGGAERQLVHLAAGLKQKGFDVKVVVFYSGGSLENELDDVGVSVQSLNKGGRWDVMGFLLRMVSCVRRECPDVIHGYLSTPNLLCSLLIPFFPKVKVVWGIRASNMDLEQYDWLSRVEFFLCSFFSRFVDCIIVNSFAGKEYHQANRFASEKMVVINNGIDTKKFEPNEFSRARFRSEIGINENEILVGIVGRADPMKDHTTFCKAASIVFQKGCNVKCVVVGAGTDDLIGKLSRNENAIDFGSQLHLLGHRDDMQDVYNGIDILCSSSLSEGFPNVIGEAMACGVPCVVTDVGDSAKIVGTMGEVVPVKNADLLAAGLMKMVDRLKSEKVLKKSVRGRIVKDFGLDHMIDTSSETIQSLVMEKVC